MASIAWISRQLLLHNDKIDLAKSDIRILLKHYWTQDYKTAAVARWICEVAGEGVVSELVAQRWFQRFNIGEDKTKYLPRSGRPKLWDNENVRRVLEENPQKSARKLSEELGDQKQPYIARLTPGESHRRCRSNFINWHLNRLNVEWISVFSLSVIPWMIDLSGGFSHVMKMSLLPQPWRLETVARSLSTC